MKWKEGQMSEGKEASRKVFFEKLYTYPQKQVQNHLLATEMGFAVTSEVCLSNTFFQGWCGYNNNRSDEDESCINWDITGTTLWELIGTYRVCVCVCVYLLSLPGSSVHEVLQARTLEWVAISFSSGSSRPRDQTGISCRQILSVWATREAHVVDSCQLLLLWSILLHSIPWTLKETFLKDRFKPRDCMTHVLGLQFE